MQDKTPIMVVDDDEIILLALKETLSLEGYRVHTFTEPPKALEALKTIPFALIISDQRMGEYAGHEFLAEAKALQADAIRILITGVLNPRTIIEALNAGEVFRFIPKPWIRSELVQHIKASFDQYLALQKNKEILEDLRRTNKALQDQNQDLLHRLSKLKPLSNSY